MIKLIALDLDDTLLMPDCSIPAEVIDALKQAASKGIKVLIATGRIYPSAKRYAEQLGTEYPIICYNGAMVRQIGQEPSYQALLPVPVMERMARFCKERGLYLQMYHNDEIVVECICEKTLVDPDSKVTQIKELGDLTLAHLQPSPKMMILDEPERLLSLKEEISREFANELHLTTSKSYLLEMMPKGVSKKETLARYTESCGIAPEETMVCGDNLNDIEMVSWAGIGVAVANAVEPLKKVATYIANKERSYGVLEAIQKFILI